MGLSAADLKSSVPAQRFRRMIKGLLGEISGLDELVESQLREYLAYWSSSGAYTGSVVLNIYSLPSKRIVAETTKLYETDPKTLDHFLGNVTLPGVLAAKTAQMHSDRLFKEALDSDFIRSLLAFYSQDFARVIRLLRRYVALILTGSEDERNLMQIGMYDLAKTSRLIVVAKQLYEDYPSEFRLCLYPEAIIRATAGIRAKDCFIVYDGRW